MDVSYFLECFSLPSTHPESIHPCLLNACYLGACVIGGGSMASFQPLFVERTRYFLSQALMFADRISHFLWASIVLSWYFTRLRRLEEASTVISPGAHLATACGLGQLDGFKANAPSGDSLWPPPRNEQEATDRKKLSYSFYIVDQVFSLISGYRATFSGNLDWGSAIELARLQRQLARDVKTAKCGTLSLWHSGEHLVAAVLKILQEVRDFALTVCETGKCTDKRAYGLLRDHICSYITLIPPLHEARSLQPWETFGVFNSATLFAHITLYGCGLILNSLQAGVDVEAGHQVLGCTRALLDVLSKIRQLRRLHGVRAGLIPVVHVTNAARIIAHRLQSSKTRANMKLCTEYCQDLEILLDYVDETYSLYPAWAEAPIRLREEILVRLSSLAR
ncbi:hypothetical protein DL93DRAFT_372450 [Clavulina sp. PMI_390]|nr:hypothetical protein DL93DRAFT_372450 [Clavulina sp. PMI_390]